MKTLNENLEGIRTWAEGLQAENAALKEQLELTRTARNEHRDRANELREQLGDESGLIKRLDALRIDEPGEHDMLTEVEFKLADQIRELREQLAYNEKLLEATKKADNTFTDEE